VSKSKGKIPRIRFAAVPPINLTGENWNTIEKSYGHTISQKVREQILRATRIFLQLVKAEKTGSIDDAIQRARRLRQGAQQVVDTIGSRPLDDIIREYVDEEIAFHYSRLKTADDDPKRFPQRLPYVQCVALEMSRFIYACDDALASLKETSRHTYWPHGGAWEGWIRELTDVMEADDLPVGVSKDTDKRPDRASPFASFVMKLQTFLPKEHVRPRQAGALAVAIHKARQESKPFAAPRKARALKTGRNTKNSAP
jgi:hypothetical protein